MTILTAADIARHHYRDPETGLCGVCSGIWPCCSDDYSHRGAQICERCGISLVFLPPTTAELG